MWIKDLKCDRGEGDHTAIVGKPALKRAEAHVADIVKKNEEKQS